MKSIQISMPHKLVAIYIALYCSSVQAHEEHHSSTFSHGIEHHLADHLFLYFLALATVFLLIYRKPLFRLAASAYNRLLLLRSTTHERSPIAVKFHSQKSRKLTKNR